MSFGRESAPFGVHPGARAGLKVASKCSLQISKSSGEVSHGSWSSQWFCRELDGLLVFVDWSDVWCVYTWSCTEIVAHVPISAQADLHHYAVLIHFIPVDKKTVPRRPWRQCRGFMSSLASFCGARVPLIVLAPLVPAVAMACYRSTKPWASSKWQRQQQLGPARTIWCAAWAPRWEMPSEKTTGVALVLHSHDGSMVLLYMVTCNMDPINISPMLAYIPYMDPMGLVLRHFTAWFFDTDRNRFLDSLLQMGWLVHLAGDDDSAYDGGGLWQYHFEGPRPLPILTKHVHGNRVSTSWLGRMRLADGWAWFYGLQGWRGRCRWLRGPHRCWQFGASWMPPCRGVWHLHRRRLWGFLWVSLLGWFPCHCCRSSHDCISWACDSRRQQPIHHWLQVSYFCLAGDSWFFRWKHPPFFFFFFSEDSVSQGPSSSSAAPPPQRVTLHMAGCPIQRTAAQQSRRPLSTAWVWLGLKLQPWWEFTHWGGHRWAILGTMVGGAQHSWAGSSTMIISCQSWPRAGHRRLQLQGIQPRINGSERIPEQMKLPLAKRWCWTPTCVSWLCFAGDFLKAFKGKKNVLGESSGSQADPRFSFFNGWWRCCWAWCCYRGRGWLRVRLGYSSSYKYCHHQIWERAFLRQHRHPRKGQFQIAASHLLRSRVW